MKKVYINPEINVVKIQPSQMIAASPETTTVEVGETVTDASGAESRSFNSIWDDEE